MNILLISIVFPYPIDAGGSTGTHKMINYLRANNTITLLCPKPSDEHYAALKSLWPDVNIQTFESGNFPEARFSLKKILKSFEPKSKPSKEQIFKKAMLLNNTNLIDYYFNELSEKVTDLCSSIHFDIAVVEFIDIAAVAHILPPTLKKVFVHHEIRHRRMLLEYHTLAQKDISDLWKINNTKLLEVSLLNLYDKVICLTDQDKVFLEQDGVLSEKLEVSPLAVQITEHQSNRPFEFTNRLVYLGPEVHFPNLDAVDWFLSNCWMPLKRLHPDLRFEIVGKWTKQSRSFYSQMPDVYFHGFVENLEEVMEGAIMVVPLRIGSGMRMKILEGVSWHMPIVSTTIGAEGLPMQNEHHCFLADSPSDFVTAVSNLIAKPDLQYRFIENSREIIQSDFSVEACGQRRLEIFEQLASNHAS